MQTMPTLDEAREARLSELARLALSEAEQADLTIATAESCTGGYLAALLASVEGMSSQLECGFVVYTEEAKNLLLGIPMAEIKRHGAVSREIVLRMARGALNRSRAGVSVAVSGFTGSAGSEENGLVHMAAADAAGHDLHREYHFGDVTRAEGWALTAEKSFGLLREAIGQYALNLREDEKAQG